MLLSSSYLTIISKLNPIEPEIFLQAPKPSQLTGRGDVAPTEVAGKRRSQRTLQKSVQRGETSYTAMWTRQARCAPSDMLGCRVEMTRLLYVDYLTK